MTAGPEQVRGMTGAFYRRHREEPKATKAIQSFGKDWIASLALAMTACARDDRCCADLPSCPTLTLHSAQFGLQCILHMHSESLITRARNKMVIKFLSDETLTHLFWIDSDIAFTPQSVCRLLLIDRDVTAGVYPMKNFNWPAAGLPAGTTREQFEDRYTEYPFNPIGHGSERVSAYADADGFVEVAEAPTGFMCIKRDVFRQMMQKYPELNYVPMVRRTRRPICTGCSSIAWSIPIPAAICRRITRSAAAGATSAARSGSISTAS
jgi:hypothetical protein